MKINLWSWRISNSFQTIHRVTSACGRNHSPGFMTLYHDRGWNAWGRVMGVPLIPARRSMHTVDSRLCLILIFSNKWSWCTRSRVWPWPCSLIDRGVGGASGMWPSSITSCQITDGSVACLTAIAIWCTAVVEMINTSSSFRSPWPRAAPISLTLSWHLTSWWLIVSQLSDEIVRGAGWPASHSRYSTL